MLPSWHNRLYIAISPTHLSWLKLSRGFKPTILFKHDETIVPQNNHPWRTVLDRCAQLLSQPEWQNNEVNIVLSNRLARFATIPGSAQLDSYMAKEAFARHGLTQIYGAVAEQWALRIHQGRKGETDLITAVDQALLDELRQVCDAHRLKINLVTPYLTSVFNRFYKTINTEPAWFVIHEPNYSLIGLVSGGGLISLNGVNQSGIDELPVLLDRESLVSSLLEPCKIVYLFAPTIKSISKITHAGYEFKRLELSIPDGFPSSFEGVYAMVMSEMLR